MLKTKLSLIGILLTLLIFAQNVSFDKDYNPIQFQGKIPAEFLFDASEVSKQEIKKNKELSKSGAQDYFISSNYIQNSLMNSGFVYFNDPLTEMVNKVAGVILKEVADEDAKKLKFYVTKFDIPNAFCWRNGAIYFNVGLLKDLENEAQLAYILCHEIIHYQEQHSITYYKKVTNEISKSERKKNKKEKKEIGEAIDKNLSKVVLDLKFSRSQESEADTKGFSLFKKTNYDWKEAANSLRILAKYREEPDYFIPPDLFSVFNNETFKIDTLDLYEDEVLDTVFIDVKDLDTDSLEFYSTHPDIDKRIEALETILEKNEEKNGVLFNFYDNKWNDFQTIIDFELVNFYDDIGDYRNLFYKTLKMLEIYPNNTYLVNKYAKSLFWLSIYNYNNKMTRVSKRDVFNEKSYTLYSLYKFIRKEKFIPSQFETLLAKFPDNNTVKVYFLRFEEFVNVKDNKADYKKIDAGDSEITNFLNYKSKTK